MCEIKVFFFFKQNLLAVKKNLRRGRDKHLVKRIRAALAFKHPVGRAAAAVSVAEGQQERIQIFAMGNGILGCAIHRRRSSGANDNEKMV